MCMLSKILIFHISLILHITEILLKLSLRTKRLDRELLSKKLMVSHFMTLIPILNNSVHQRTIETE